MVNFWTTIIGNLSNNDGDGNENGKKVTGFYERNNNFAHESRLCDMKLPNFTHPLYRESEKKNTNIFSLSVSNLRYGPCGLNPRKFRQHLTN